MASRSLLLLALALTGATAMSAASVETRHDPKVDFSQFHTYVWKTEKGPTAPDVDLQIRAAAEAELAERGLKKAKGEEKADLVLIYNAGLSDSLVPGGFGVGLGWWGGFIGVPTGESNVSAGIAFFLRRADSDELIWAGWLVQKATNDYAPILLRQKAPKFAKKILSRYPPD